MSNELFSNIPARPRLLLVATWAAGKLSEPETDITDKPRPHELILMITPRGGWRTVGSPPQGRRVGQWSARHGGTHCNHDGVSAYPGSQPRPRSSSVLTTHHNGGSFCGIEEERVRAWLSVPTGYSHSQGLAPVGTMRERSELTSHAPSPDAKSIVPGRAVLRETQTVQIS